MPLVSKTFSQIITFTRASTATFFDATGTLQSATTDVPRFDYNPATLAARGFLIEEARTNSIRNNTMQGAVAGTPGTLPTNWIAQNIGGVALTEVVGTGTENGIAYVDVRFTGTTSSTATGGILAEQTTQIAALSGQTWASSFFLKIVGGSTANISDIFNSIQERDAGGALLAQTNTTITPTGAALNTQRFSTTRTLNNASTAFVGQRISITPVSGAAIDITLRIGLPQLELGAFATSVIPTTTTALTRAADVASVNTLSPWFNASEGTLYVEGQISAGIDAIPAILAGLDDTTTSNRMQARRQSPGTIGDFRFVSSGGNFTNTATVGTLTGVNKHAFAYAASDQACSINGTLMTGITPVATLPTITRLALGSGPGSTPTNGWIRRITYYPRKLSSAELQAITS